MTTSHPLDPKCPACIVNLHPPPEPADAYIAAVVEMEEDRDEVLRYLCSFHQKMKDLFREAKQAVDRLHGRETPKENVPS